MMGSESTVDIIRIGIDKIELRVSIFLWNIEGNDGLQKKQRDKNRRNCITSYGLMLRKKAFTAENRG